MHLIATPSGEEAQMLMSTSSERGLNRDVRATYMLRVRTEPECPEDNLRELTRLHTGPSPHRRRRGRRATARAERRGAISAPYMAPCTKQWAGSQLLTEPSWDPGWLTPTRRVTVRDQLPRGDTQHTWDVTLAEHPGNPGAGTRRW